MRFSLGPQLFGDRPFDAYADIEARLQKLETYAAIRGVQSVEFEGAGPFTIPDSATYVNLVTVPSDELNIPRDDSMLVMTMQMDVAASGCASSIRSLIGRLNSTLWGGVTFTPFGSANWAATTLYSRPDYSDLTSSSFAPWAFDLPERIPMVYVPGASGPYALTLDVRRDLLGHGGTVTVTNVILSIDVL